MNAQFKKGVMELCVLAQLARDDQYGYELTETISSEMEIATATLYVVLKRLKDDGYVETYLKESSSGPARKYYTLTEQGREKYNQLFDEWREFKVAVDKLIGEPRT